MGVVPWRTRNQAVPLLDDPSGLVILAAKCCSDVAVVADRKKLPLTHTFHLDGQM
jgi:hypothetical protein